MAPFFLLTFSIFLFPLAHAIDSQPHCSFKSIYQFGDSLADTGNLIRIPGGVSGFRVDRSPYGETFFRRPTGRFSNGRLIVDFTASALRLPFVPPYLDSNASFATGANFAVAGATALDQDFFEERNISTTSFRPPMSAQLRWFESHLNSTCHASARVVNTRCVKRKLREALVVFGAFGGNDYSSAVFRGKSIEEIKTYVPFIVNAVINGVKRIIRMGVTRILFPGTYPSGCLPNYQTAFSGPNPNLYNDLGCLKKYNNYSSYYNGYLRRAVTLLGKELSSSGVVVVYANYYNGFRSVLRWAGLLGFDTKSLFKASCGIGGNHNYDGKRTCGSNGVPVCPDLARFLSWDGVHLTEEANRHVSEVVLGQVFKKFKCNI